MKIDKVFVEFGGDPKKDSEIKKRYCSIEKFEWNDPGTEIIEFVSKEKFLELEEQNRMLVEALRKTIGVVKSWHGEGAFDLYMNHSPEMKPAREALASLKEDV